LKLTWSVRRAVIVIRVIQLILTFRHLVGQLLLLVVVVRFFLAVIVAFVSLSVLRS
jgi:hypothetical protein